MNSKRRILLIDGVGAFVTAFLLFFLLSRFDHVVGMPKEILHVLSLVAAIFGIYSISCFFLVTEKWKLFLIAIAIANAVYCIATLTLILYYYSNMSWWSFTYFIGEIAIIACIISFEFKAAKTSS